MMDPILMLIFTAGLEASGAIAAGAGATAGISLGVGLPTIAYASIL